MNFRPMVVWVDLAGPIAGHPPMLDGLAIGRAALLTGAWQRQDRQSPAPDPRDVPIPIRWSNLGGHVVYHCSAPIIGQPDFDLHEYYHRRFPTDRSDWLDESERTQVPTGMGWTKSYRLPNRVRGVHRVCWIVEANWRELRKLLKGVSHIGKDVSQGYGAVRRNEDGTFAWDHAEADSLDGAWWYGRHEEGPVLMRQMPLGEWLPEGLLGGRRDFDACSPPYWHPERKTEIMAPC